MAIQIVLDSCGGLIVIFVILIILNIIVYIF